MVIGEEEAVRVIFPDNQVLSQHSLTPRRGRRTFRVAARYFHGQAQNRAASDCRLADGDGWLITLAIFSQKPETFFPQRQGAL